ncbi:transglutaminase-like domain-containing protein [Candidatus Stoquefichus massiliensis]|uniref:transglutaminase-like domain-containing protein n=1 Tax=Candidatus Stoquefichus massiliensis TaxID=1470350 RepID=UPI0004B0B12D|nr:transglutaminase-like domain-containing protein [Candidatus Stoquefichus massiliensis]
MKETFCLDNHPSIERLIYEKGWLQLGDVEKVKAIYNFVSNDILFGYNKEDYRLASLILKDGYGQCNTKAILLMDLLRYCHIECRLHGATVDKALQKGILSGIIYHLSPQEIIHSWVEVFIQGNWYVCEGVILDKNYLLAIQNRYPQKIKFCGYAVAVKNLQTVDVNWSLNDTYIQKEALVKDLGIYKTPDDFYQNYHQNINILKRWVYQHIVRHWMNHKVKKLRGGK